MPRTFGVRVEVSCQRSTPSGPVLMGAGNAGGVVEAGPAGSVAVAEVGDHPLQRVEAGRVTPAGGGMGVQRREGRSGEVLQAGAAVDQQGLAEDAG